MKPPATFSLRLPAEIAEKINRLASQDRRSKANVVRVLIAEALAARGLL